MNIALRRMTLFRARPLVWSVQFYQQNDGIAFGSGASIDDLFLADCTIEAWVRIAEASATTYFVSKSNGGNGWFMYVTPARIPTFYVYFAVDPLVVAGPALELDKWYHLALDWDVGTVTGRFFVQGALVATDTSTGAYSADAAQDAIVNGYAAIGTADDTGSIGPIRLSDVRRYTTDTFSPPTMNNWPANDANAQLLIPMNDGAGVTATDYSGNGSHGTITFGADTRWYHGLV